MYEYDCNHETGNGILEMDVNTNSYDDRLSVYRCFNCLSTRQMMKHGNSDSIYEQRARLLGGTGILGKTVYAIQTQTTWLQEGMWMRDAKYGKQWYFLNIFVEYNRIEHLF